jgi:hypothetical protein
MNMRADKLAGTAHTSLPHDFTARHDSLHLTTYFTLSTVPKMTSKITQNVAHSFHRPKLQEHNKVQEEWIQITGDDIAWKSCTITFNKTPTAGQPTLTKLIFSFWCKNIRHQKNQGIILQC